MGQAFEQGNEQRVILDTSVCIEILKEKQGSTGLFGSLDLVTPHISAVTVFELMFRTYNAKQAEDFIVDAEVINFDGKSARKASEIALELKHKGTPIEAADLFIAATALANNCTLATLNVKDFSRIKGLKLVRLR